MQGETWNNTENYRRPQDWMGEVLTKVQISKIEKEKITSEQIILRHWILMQQLSSKNLIICSKCEKTKIGILYNLWRIIWETTRLSTMITLLKKKIHLVHHWVGKERLISKILLIMNSTKKYLTAFSSNNLLKLTVKLIIFLFIGRLYIGSRL